MVAIGGRGGAGADAGGKGGQGGFGAVATADVPVTPGQVLYIEVATNGFDGGPCSGIGCVLVGLGGFNGGGNAGRAESSGGVGGGGGGASDVRTSSMSSANSLASRLISAAGGGGGGGGGDSSGFCKPPTMCPGSPGGAAGTAGGGLTVNGSSGGGGAGTSTCCAQGGSAGGLATDGGNGSLGTGGNGGGGNASQDGGSGGGGGGGYYGGGGGAAGPLGLAGGGGGGGGSSAFAPSAANGTVVADVTAMPSIAFTYTPRFALSVTIAGTGGGSVESADGRLNCSETCSASFDKGSQVTLTATPAAGSRFASWSGSCSGNGQCQVTMTNDNAVTAIFQPVSTGGSQPTRASEPTITAHISRKNHRAKFTFTAGGATAFQCALIRKHVAKTGEKPPSPRFVTCSSPKIYTRLKPGKYTFEVRGRSPLGPGPVAEKNFRI